MNKSDLNLNKYRDNENCINKPTTENENKNAYEDLQITSDSFRSLK